jgi:hypothetical protein
MMPCLLVRRPNQNQSNPQSTAERSLGTKGDYWIYFSCAPGG